MTWQTEWRSIVTLTDGDRSAGVHHHSSKADAEHFKEWREGLSGLGPDGRVWPEVTIQIESRQVTDWEVSA